MLSKRLQNFVPAFTNCAHTIPDRTNQIEGKKLLKQKWDSYINIYINIYLYTCGLYVYVYNHQSTSGHRPGFILYILKRAIRKIDSNHS